MRARFYIASLVIFSSFIFGAASVSALESTYGDIEKIQKFVSDITVKTDGTVSVIEKITVNFPEPRHGLDREIPVVYRDKYNNRQKIFLTVRSVTDQNGQPLTYRVSRQGDKLRIRIGDADKTISGEQTYVIAYVVRRALLFFDDRDELYWNVSGSDWRLPIEEVSASVELPPGADPSRVSTSCYSGPIGSTESNCGQGETGGLYFFTAREPLTIAIGWSAGLVTRPGAWERFRDFVIANAALFAPILVFIALLWTWWTRGRDPKTGTIMAEYEPPDKFFPAALSALVHERVKSSAIGATVVDFAVRGYLKIVEREKHGLFGGQRYELKKIKDPDPLMAEREAEFFRALFDHRALVHIDSLAKDTGFQKKRQEFQDSVLSDQVKAGYFASNPKFVRTAYLIAGFLVAFVTAFFFELIEEWLGASAVAAFLISAGLIALFGLIMPRRLPKGARAYRQAKGFKLYLEMAEKHRIEWQVKENLFEKFLPYAVIFGVVSAWASAFKDAALSEPNWFVSSAGAAFNPVSFSESITGFSSSAAHAIAPSSSGSSGGGSSGGGFGGGGGGSW